MARVPVFIISLLIFLACKKERNDGRQMYLSKAYADGLLSTEIIYSSDMKPVRRNFYNTGTGQSVFNGFRSYEYDIDGRLITVSRVGSNYQFQERYELQYDNNNRVSRMDDIGSNGTLNSYYLYSYNQQNLLVELEFFSAAHTKMAEVAYRYDDNGLPHEAVRWSYSGGNPVKFDSAMLSFEKPLPGHWIYFEALPQIALPNGDRLFMDMICTSSFYYFVDAPPFTSTTGFSQKTYNSQRYLVRQMMERVSQGIGPPVNTTAELTYEYVE